MTSFLSLAPWPLNFFSFSMEGDKKLLDDKEIQSTNNAIDKRIGDEILRLELKFALQLINKN